MGEHEEYNYEVTISLRLNATGLNPVAAQINALEMVVALAEAGNLHRVMDRIESDRQI